MLHVAEFLPPDKKINIREAKLKSQRVLNINPAIDDPLAMGVVTAATAKVRTKTCRHRFAPFDTKNDHSAQTGSGQTQGKALKTETRFLAGQHTDCADWL
jgi:hypothetical protein